MNYNSHIEKYHIKDVRGIKMEQFREYKDKTKYINFVDTSKSNSNVYIDLTDDGSNWFQHIKIAKDDTAISTGKKVREDAVVICSIVESVPKGWSNDVVCEYFNEKAEWYKNHLHTIAGVDEGKVLTVCIHLDESTPHATIAFIPEKDGRLQAKNILTRHYLQRMQADGFAYTNNWIKLYESKHLNADLEKLDKYEVGSKAHHLDEVKYKEQKAMEHVEEIEATMEYANQLKFEYEAKVAGIVSLTNSPNIESYESLIKENEELKKELSLKDRIIQDIRDEKDRLKEKMEEYEKVCLDIINKIGSKLLEYIGYKDINGINVYPSSSLVNGINEINEEIRQCNSNNLRVIRDKEHGDRYRIVEKENDGSNRTIKGNIENLPLAEKEKRDIIKYQKSIGGEEEILDNDLDI